MNFPSTNRCSVPPVATKTPIEELAHIAVFISDVATLVRPRRRLTVVKDEPDNRVLECALTGNADAIVTGDHELLALREFRGVRLFSLRDYLDFSAT